MSASTYWQAKIWGLLHDPALKALHSNFSDEGQWNILQCMQGWQSPKNPQTHSQTDLNGTWLKYVGLSDLIASASDRNTIGRLPANQTAIRYNNEGLQIRHLLSGEPQPLILEQWHQRINNFDRNSREIEDFEKVVIPDEIKNSTDAQKVFWWLWRCYIPALANALGGESDEQAIYLLPAETRLPDASLWSHVTMTSALAGSLAGYYKNPEDYPKTRDFVKGKESRPYIATFTFTPIQDLIKASRKMRDFWAGSWLLHYLSAKVCWAIAQKYGPDSLLYPCLYAQPLIDYWLLEKYRDFPAFKEFIKEPSEQQLLTAGFPNVLVMILPNNGKAADEVSNNPVQAAVKYAEDVLKQEWKKLGDEVLDFLRKDNGKGGKQWREINPHTWDGWLKSQWQIYWTALPIGEGQAELHQSPRQKTEYEEWIEKQNNFANPLPELFVPPEYKFLEAVFKATAPTEPENPDIAESREKYKARQPNMNVGSWWASIFDQTRFALNAVKNARIWQLPTAFSPRSTVSGIGSVVHPIYDQSKPDWATEGQTADFWAENMGLFDCTEELNATEVLKRGLHQILGKKFGLQGDKIAVLYPDLSSGVAGWLRQMETKGNQKAITYFQTACQTLINQFNWADELAKSPWGIPWIAKYHPEWSNPRLLNAGWLIDDYQPPSPDGLQVFTRQQQKEEKNKKIKWLRKQIGQLFKPGNNPTDWYVLAAGDGDGMGDWLKGVNLKPYSAYIPDELHQKIPKMPDNIRDSFQEFLHITKRMGPSTHSALSRALLDFSNQLVPYLTEERYAGRLIYGGGDDVLAYTNLWEWDKWLWDIRQCFRGGEDPGNEFASQGDYWRWNQGKVPENLTTRPLFTMGSTATISFGIVIAHHSVPLAIALENLWEAEEKAKEHKSPDGQLKDAVQVRVLYGNGNILKSTAKFDVFNQWKMLLNISTNLESSIFEQAAEIWEQHPAPVIEAIVPWTNVFCDRRDIFKKDESAKKQFQKCLADFLQALSSTTEEKQCDNQIQSWLKLAAFVLRNRTIKI